MSQRTRLFFLVIILVILSTSVHHAPLQIDAKSVITPLDLVFVIDNSQSMDGDSDNLRYLAVEMMVDLLSERDRVGVISFSSAAKTLTPELVSLRSSTAREELKALLTVEPDGGTNYKDALKHANDLLKTDTGNQRAVIFLTDANPDPWSEDQLTPIEDLKAAGIPVFLIMVDWEKSNQEHLHIVEQTFRSTNAEPVFVKDYTDFAKAFAGVLTHLNPGLYLDIVEGHPGAAGELVFDPEVHSKQRVSSVDFVFVPMSQSSNFNVSSESKPDNAQQQLSSNEKYRILSYESTNAQPLDGQWIFNTPGNTYNAVEVFALIQSDIELELKYPQPSLDGQLLMAPDQLLPIGVEVIGAELESEQLSINVRPGTHCEVIDRENDNGRQTYELHGTGLSDNNTVHWRALSGLSNENLVVNIEFGQLEEPLRLSRCFTMKPASLPNNVEIDVIRPTGVDTLISGGIPVTLDLPQIDNWHQVIAYNEDPAGNVSSKELLKNENGYYAGVVGGVGTQGKYKIRVLAIGSIDGQVITFFAQTEYDVDAELIPETNPIDLGTQTQLGQTLGDEIVLLSSLLDTSTYIDFTVLEVQETNTGNSVPLSQINPEVCATPTYTDGKFHCTVEVTPVDALEPGLYDVTIGIDAPEVDLPVRQIHARFERPQPRIEWPLSEFDLGNFTGVTDTLAAKINFEMVLLNGDLALDHYVTVHSIYDTNKHENIPTDMVNIEINKLGSSNLRSYELVAKAESALPAGVYAAEISLESGIENVQIVPETVLVTFSKDMSLVYLNFEGSSYKTKENSLVINDKIWGIPYVPKFLEFLFPKTVYIDVPVTCDYEDCEFNLPEPKVINLVPDPNNQEINPKNQVTFSWRCDGYDVENEHWDYTLIMRIGDQLLQGQADWKISTEFLTPDGSENMRTLPQEQKFVLKKVFGWRQFFWRRALEGGFLLILLIARLGNRSGNELDITLSIKGQGFDFHTTDTKYLIKADGKLAVSDTYSETYLAKITPQSNDIVIIEPNKGKRIELSRGKSIKNLRFYN